MSSLLDVPYVLGIFENSKVETKHRLLLRRTCLKTRREHGRTRNEESTNDEGLGGCMNQDRKG